MEIERLFLRHFWAIGCLFALLNAALIHRRSRKYVAEKPERAAGYQKLIWGFLLLNSIWLIVAAGVFSGQMTGVLDLLRPPLENPFVLIFHVLALSVWILAFRWIILGSGAQFLADHPGLGGWRLSAPQFKFATCLVIAAGLAAMIVIWTGNVLPQLAR